LITTADTPLQLHSYNIQPAVTQDKNDTAQTWSVCNKGFTQFLPAIHTRTIPCLYSTPQGITALSLVLIAPTHEGMARLSWRGWLVRYRNKCHGIEPGYVL